MEKTLITGADGFIGSHLTELLLDKGYRVRALAQYNSFNYWGWLEDIPGNENLEIVTGDVRDPHFCKKITKDIDVIFHLAALIAIPYSYIAPDSYIDTNVKGTLNICQAAKENEVKRIIHASTSEVYGTAQYVPIDEKHPLRAQSPYSASKIGADAIAQSFFYSFGLPLIIARPFNTFGPRQSARAIIPTIITQLAVGKKEISLGNVESIRDFNYVKDTCAGLLALAKSKKTIGEIVNIGSNRETSIGNLFIIIQELMKTNAVIREARERFRPDNSEVYRLRCNNEKLEQLTGFKPQFSLKDGLNETVRWYIQTKNIKHFKIDTYIL